MLVDTPLRNLAWKDSGRCGFNLLWFVISNSSKSRGGIGQIDQSIVFHVRLDKKFVKVRSSPAGTSLHMALKKHYHAES